ncbi:MAG: prepilin-type N-terminal cleavage/methylation domain-containing protein [Candidatus Omnitrophica bacterium]|nr:prepilin-type N-terminal cleavage/methylation domain-containing protein [Candidatus Omnitrophota bacterium]
MKNKQNNSFTLIELIIAVFLLSMVVLTAVTVELSLRKMQVKPEVQAKLIDELVPVIERIKNDFEKQIGSLHNTSVYIQDSGRRLSIRTDSDNTGTVTDGDAWHAYRWNGTAGNPIEYSPSNFTTSDAENIAYGITDFYVNSGYDNTTLTIRVKTRKDPSQAENLFTNLGVNLTTTVYSRMTSAK